MSQKDDKTKGSSIIVLSTAIGICCILQFFVVGIINIIRGYSIETYLPSKILLVGVVAFIVISFRYPKKSANVSFFIYTVSFAIIYMSLISLSQGRYIEEAERYYNSGQYQLALQTYEKEAKTWYHLLKFNYHERKAMNMMAKTYCQLEDFDSARNIYNLMIDRYSKEFYGERARESLEQLEDGLKIAAYYPDRLAEMPKPDYFITTEVHLPPKHSEVSALYDIALTYKFHLNCHAKAYEVYTKILGMDISEVLKKLAKEQRAELRVDADRN